MGASRGIWAVSGGLLGDILGPKRPPTRGPQVTAQDGPEGPKMHPREVKDDVANENDGKLKNDDPLNENA